MFSTQSQVELSYCTDILNKTKNHNLVKDATSRRLAKFDWSKKPEGWKLTKFKETGFKVDTRRPRADSVK